MKKKKVFKLILQTKKRLPFVRFQYAKLQQVCDLLKSLLITIDQALLTDRDVMPI